MALDELTGTRRFEWQDGSYGRQHDGSGISIIVKGADGLIRVQSPAFPGEEALVVDLDTYEAAERVFIRRWLRWAAVTIGGGFHVDKRAADYADSMPACVLAGLDDLIGIAFRHCKDPYEVAIDAWRKARTFPDLELGGDADDLIDLPPQSASTIEQRLMADPSSLTTDDLLRQRREAAAVISSMKMVLAEARAGLVAYTGGADGACRDTIDRIDRVSNNEIGDLYDVDMLDSIQESIPGPRK